MRRVGALDMMGIPYPQEYGGAGGDSLAYALAVELAAFGLTEPEAGSDAGNTQTRALCADGGSNILVENGTSGYEQGEPYRKMGWNASDTRLLSFADCRVPKENLVGKRGAGLRQFLQAVCRFYRDAKILTIGEDTDEVQQMVIARALGA